MKKWAAMAVLLCFVALPAFADVTNEVFVGFQGDGTNKVTDAAGNDITDSLKTRNSQFVLQYTHFFSPLKDDEKPIELHRFYQHPSSLSIGLITQGQTVKDNGIPADTKKNVGMLILGGELYLATNTGFFVDFGGGSGKIKNTVAGIDQPDTDIEVSRFDFGVRQYIGPEFMLQVRFQGETTKYTPTIPTPSGFPETTSDTGLVFFGVRGVIRDTLGLAAEIGGGERNDKISGNEISYDVGRVNLEGDVYVGKELSFGLAIEGETQKRTTLPEHETKRARTTLIARYWFSEKAGLQVPIYGETTKNDGSQKRESNGFGLYGTFRF